MKTSDTLMLGIIYPGVEPYLADYFNSLLAQTDQDFDLLILRHRDKNISTAVQRQQAIDWALSARYKYLIFTDTDDFFSPVRVEMTKSILEDCDFVYNELELVDEVGRFLKPDVLQGLDIKNEYNRVDEIVDRNLFGLSNTAVRVKALKGLHIPSDIIAVDWWIYTILLLQNRRGNFIQCVRTFYRQTAGNTGMKQPLTEERLARGIKVKIAHYKNIWKYCVDNHIGEVQLYKDQLDNMNKLKKDLRKKDARREYITVINSNMDTLYKGWWSEIIPLWT